jgi:hypothetical protein
MAPRGKVTCRQACALARQLGAFGEDALDIDDRTAHPVEADARQAHPGLGLPTCVRDHHQGLAGPDDVAGVLGEAAVQPDVDRAPHVARREDLRGAPVDHDRAVSEAALEILDTEADGRLGVVQQVTQPPVAVGRVGEVQRRHRLALGGDLHERVLRQRLERVVPAPLLTNRRRHRIGHRLAARRTRPMRREHPRLVGQRQQLVVQGPVEPAGQLLGTETYRGEQVGTSDVADEQGVAGQDRARDRVGRVLPHHHRDRLGRVAGVCLISSTTSPTSMR